MRVMTVFAHCLLFTSICGAAAAPIQPGAASYGYTNVFTSVLFPGTPFNPGPDPVSFPVFSEGTFATEWGTQSGSTIPFEITSVVADGFLPTMPPTPFQILAGVDQVPHLGPFAGSYSNVVQDPSDPGFPTGEPSSLVSADVLVEGPFAQVLGDGTFLYATNYTFVGWIDGLPYPPGTTFVGTQDADVHVQVGSTPDPSVDPVIGQILAGGVITVVPEPTATVLLCGSLMGLLGMWRRSSSVKTS